MQFGVVWIAISLVVFYFISMIINIAPNRKILDYGYIDQFKDVVLNMIPAFVMGIIVYPLSLLHMHSIFVLVIQIIAGILIYLGLSILVHNESYHFALKYIKNNILKKRGHKYGEV